MDRLRDPIKPNVPAELGRKRPLHMGADRTNACVYIDHTAGTRHNSPLISCAFPSVLIEVSHTSVTPVTRCVANRLVQSEDPGHQSGGLPALF